MLLIWPQPMPMAFQRTMALWMATGALLGSRARSKPITATAQASTQLMRFASWKVSQGGSDTT